LIQSSAANNAKSPLSSHPNLLKTIADLTANMKKLQSSGTAKPQDARNIANMARSIQLLEQPQSSPDGTLTQSSASVQQPPHPHLTASIAKLTGIVQGMIKPQFTPTSDTDAIVPQPTVAATDLGGGAIMDGVPKEAPANLQEKLASLNYMSPQQSVTGVGFNGVGGIGNGIGNSQANSAMANKIVELTKRNAALQITKDSKIILELNKQNQQLKQQAEGKQSALALANKVAALAKENAFLKGQIQNRNQGTNVLGSSLSANRLDMQFACASGWPDAVHMPYWKQYCQLQGTKTFAMTGDCTFTWYSGGSNAAVICSQKAAQHKLGACILFDSNGAQCKGAYRYQNGNDAKGVAIRSALTQLQQANDALAYQQSHCQGIENCRNGMDTMKLKAAQALMYVQRVKGTSEPAFSGLTESSASVLNGPSSYGGHYTITVNDIAAARLARQTAEKQEMQTETLINAVTLHVKELNNKVAERAIDVESSERLHKQHQLSETALTSKRNVLKQRLASETISKANLVKNKEVLTKKSAKEMTTKKTEKETINAAAKMASFTCSNKWPIVGYVKSWEQYCKAAKPKAFAMNTACNYAWFVSGAKKIYETSVTECTSKAARRSPALGKCFLFDVNGNKCNDKNTKEILAKRIRVQEAQQVYHDSMAKAAVPGSTPGKIAYEEDMIQMQASSQPSHECKSSWPAAGYEDTWKAYCALSGPKSFSMNSKCNYAWYAAGAADKARTTCSKGAKARKLEDCTTFDVNGKQC